MIVELLSYRQRQRMPEKHAEQMEEQDLAKVLDELPIDLTESVFSALVAEDHCQRVEAVLGYPEGTAGRLMSTDVISVRSDVTLAVVLR
jgi:magnesium transporter